jgi:23S rRNA pseudouridine1911/1915/1917 synthase
MNLSDWLRRKFPTAKQQTLKRMVLNRRVRIGATVATRLDQPVQSHDRVTIEPGRNNAPPPAKLPFTIIFEDRDILVIDKPPGLLTSTVPREPRPTAIAAIAEYLADSDPRAKPGLIHRLDREASGLLIFSKNTRAFQSLKKQFFHHTVERVYHAIVSPVPKTDSGRIESILAERADGSVHSVSNRGRGQAAMTMFDVANRRGAFALLRIKLHTGRKHQIRVHLSESGWPVLGDTIYGGKSCKKGLMLAAIKLAVDHPLTGERKIFTVPENCDRILAAFMAIGAESESV